MASPRRRRQPQPTVFAEIDRSNAITKDIRDCVNFGPTGIPYNAGTNASTLNSLLPVRFATVTVTTGGLLYYFQPFSIAQLFGGVMPQFWTMYMAHNLSAALGTNTNRFSYNGITY